MFPLPFAYVQATEAQTMLATTYANPVNDKQKYIKLVIGPLLRRLEDSLSGLSNMSLSLPSSSSSASGPRF